MMKEEFPPEFKYHPDVKEARDEVASEIREKRKGRDQAAEEAKEVSSQASEVSSKGRISRFFKRKEIKELSDRAEDLQKKSEDLQRDSKASRAKGKTEIHEATKTAAAERGPKLPLFVAYRDNSLYREYIPVLVAKLQELGREVEFHAFPEDNSEEEIGDWLEANSEQLVGRSIVSDGTTKRSFSKETLQDLKNKTMASVGTNRIFARGKLDVLFDEAAENSIFQEIEPDLSPDDFTARMLYGFSGFDRIADKERIGRAVKLLLERVLEDSQKQPERVFISTDRIIDHAPFDEHLKSGGDRGDGKGREEAHRAAEELKSWLLEVGISEDKITIGDDKGQSIAGEPHTWIFIDRHTGVGPISDGEDRAKILNLPLGNLYESLRSQGLLDLRDNELKDQVEKLAESL